MSDNTKLKKLRLALITAAIASGITAMGSQALASDEAISQKEMYTQAVVLYEKLTGSEVEVPQALAELCDEASVSKAVMLGFANADEINSVSEEPSLRKQDAMTVLYKTIIDFDDSFALTSDEVDEILNTCNDNALLDEENRVGYAFMIKHGIINCNVETEPNKEITLNSCQLFIDSLYDLFVQDVSFSVGETVVKIGANIESVTDVLGEPSRIDKSDCGFDWYIYNSDYNNFMMVGVRSGRICAFFSNSRALNFNGITPGSSMLETYNYSSEDGFRFFSDDDGLFDAILFNTAYLTPESADLSSDPRAFELIDIINSYRAGHELPVLEISKSLTEQVQKMAGQPKYTELALDDSRDHIMDGAHHEADFDIFSIYDNMLTDGGEFFEPSARTIAVSTSITDKYQTVASIAIENESTKDAVATDAAGLDSIVPEPEVSPEPSEATEAPAQPAEAAKEKTVEEETSPAAISEETPDFAIVNPYENAVVSSENDLKIELDKEYENKFYVRIFSYEDDEYIVNSYIKPEGKTITINKDSFIIGRDYRVSISKISETGTSAEQSFSFTYGEAPEDAVAITSLDIDPVIDDDAINLTWDSELYRDFVVDIYNEDGQLMVTHDAADTHEASIRNIEPGSYYLYVTAVRHGDKSIGKAQDYRHITIKLPEPLISEYILEEGEKFYPVYTDDDLGLVYFYDEDIIDVDEIDKKGRTVSVKKKKITEKQVKATGYYKLLANAQQKIPYFTGSDKKDIITDANGVVSANYHIGVSSSNDIGNAIVEEAKKYLGIPYLWGGTTPNGFDCSGLAQYVHASLGIKISRTTYTQINEGTPIPREQLQPGDLVFFQSGGDVHHVGIYAGDGMMIHAPYTGSYIQYQSIDNSEYYSSQFCGGRRMY